MTPPLTEQQLAGMKARVAAAFPGPWFVDSLEETGGTTSIGVATDGDSFIIELSDIDPADAEFIAFARTDVPALLEEVEGLRSAARAAAVILRSVADRVEMRQQANPAALRGNAAELDRIAGIAGGKASPTGPTQTADACARCRRPFDPRDLSFDGHARERDTAFCRRCVDRCHESEDAGHACPVCRPVGSDAR